MAKPTGAAPRPMRADARRNYERLITEARDAFGRHGADASLDEIAKRAGVGPGTLYRHFPNRQALLQAVTQEWLTQLRSESEALMAAPPAEALHDWMRMLVRYTNTYRGLSAALIAAFADEESELRPSCDEIQGIGVAMIRRAQAAGTVRADVDARDVLRVIAGVAYITDKTSGDPADADRLLRLLTEGLRPRA